MAERHKGAIRAHLVIFVASENNTSNLYCFAQFPLPPWSPHAWRGTIERRRERIQEAQRAMKHAQLLCCSLRRTFRAALYDSALLLQSRTSPHTMKAYVQCGPWWLIAEYHKLPTRNSSVAQWCYSRM